MIKGIYNWIEISKYKRELREILSELTTKNKMAANGEELDNLIKYDPEVAGVSGFWNKEAQMNNYPIFVENWIDLKKVTFHLDTLHPKWWKHIYKSKVKYFKMSKLKSFKGISNQAYKSYNEAKVYRDFVNFKALETALSYREASLI